MGLFDDLKKEAEAAYNAKRGEIGKYVGDFFGQAIKNAGAPTQAPVQAAPSPAAAAVATVSPYMKYALPAAAVLAVVLLLRKKG